MRIRIYLLILAILFNFVSYAQTDPSTWIELGFSKKVVKNLKVEFNPELRAVW